jgi:uncharacterized protein (DUF58 family)
MAEPEPSASKTPPAAVGTRPTAKRRGLRGGLGFTGEGRLFVLMTLGVGAAAVNTGNNLLYLVLGLMLSLIILSGALSDLVLFGVAARRRLPQRAFARAPCLVELELTNLKRWLPSFSLSATDELEAAPARPAASPPGGPRTYFLKIDGRSSQRAGYLLTPERRGRLRLARVRLATRYPFGFFDKWRSVDCVDELLVLPAIVAVPDLERQLEALSGRDASHEEARRRAREQGTELAGLRPYREGDEARAIHWRRSAALGAPVVRELERDPGQELALRVETVVTPADAEAAARLERVLSRAASIAILAHERGAHVEVLTRDGRSPRIGPGASIDPLLAFLALAEPRPAADAPFAAARRAALVLEITDATPAVRA